MTGETDSPGGSVRNGDSVSGNGPCAEGGPHAGVSAS